MAAPRRFPCEDAWSCELDDEAWLELEARPKRLVLPVGAGAGVATYELFEPVRPAQPAPPPHILDLPAPFDWPADYSPFGRSFPRSFPAATPSPPRPPQTHPPQPPPHDPPPLADLHVKKRIVAEVKPMRPTYSDILSKTPKNGTAPEIPAKKPFNVRENPKVNTVKPNVIKYDKSQNFNLHSEKISPTDEKPKKFESDKRKTVSSQTSSGSDCSEYNTEIPKPKPAKKFPAENADKRWISYEELANDSCNADVKQERNYTEGNSEFVLIDRGEEEKIAKKKSSKRSNNSKNAEKTEPKSEREAEEEEEEEEEEEVPDDPEDFEEIVYQEQNVDTEKSKKRNKESRSSAKSVNKNNSDKNKRNNQYKVKKPKNNEYLALVQTYVQNWIALMLSCLFWLFNLVSDVCRMSAQLSADLFSSLCTETFIRAQTGFALAKEKATSTQWLYNFGNYIDNKLGHTYVGFWRKMNWFKTDAKKESESDYQKKNHTNIPLPSTGEEAMKRLLACKGKDPYSILGVGVQCSDDDIKRYYRRQAFLVHPDKNQQPGAEEAFKILQHAFDMIGEPERREAYEQTVLETRHAEAARNELADLVARLQEKVRRAASTIRCSGCSNRHARTPTNRACYAARYCSQCHIHHSAKEGDIWAESSFWGLIWMYYACMDGAVYQITQWASCQKKNLKHLKANTHHVQYRIVLGNKPQQGSAAKNQNNNINDADLEDFLNNLYTKSNQSTTGPTPGKTMPGGNMQTGETVRNKRKSKKSK